jgi:transmembrane sensor
MGGKSVTQSDEEIHAAIAQQAGDWFIANQAGTLSAEDSSAFLAWLMASPVNVREYLGVARIARHLLPTADDPAVPLETFLAQQALREDSIVVLESLPKRAPSVTRRIVPWTAPLAASLIGLLVTALWWAHDGELLGIPKTFRTAHGEQSLERLPDGSMLGLDTDSEATVRYTGTERVVELKRGQALFEVMHEGARRFRVAAGNTGAIVVGTRFNVYRKPGVTEITVAQGKIAVFSGTPSWLHGLGTVPADVQRVSAGFQVRVDEGSPPAQPVPVDVGDALAWAEHKIVFKHRPLGEVASEFNRYGSTPVDIEDADLRALPVSGMFDAGDTDSFVAFLRTLPGVSVERTAKGIRVIKL